MTATNDEALRVAREEMARYLPILMRLEDSPLWSEFTAGLGIATINGYVRALRTIALAVEGSAAKQDRAEGGSGQEAASWRKVCDQCFGEGHPFGQSGQVCRKCDGVGVVPALMPDAPMPAASLRIAGADGDKEVPRG